MSIQGKSPITATPDFVEHYPDMLEPAYIHFGKSAGERDASDDAKLIARRWKPFSTAC